MIVKIAWAEMIVKIAWADQRGLAKKLKSS